MIAPMLTSAQQCTVHCMFVPLLTREAHVRYGDQAMEGQKKNAATDGAEAKRPGEGPISKTKSIRRELSAILEEHNDGQLMKDLPGKAPRKLIKTKTASGLSLPRMVLTENKSKVEKKRSAVHPKGALQRRPSHYGDDAEKSRNWLEGQSKRRRVQSWRGSDV